MNKSGVGDESGGKKWKDDTFFRMPFSLDFSFLFSSHI